MRRLALLLATLSLPLALPLGAAAQSDTSPGNPAAGRALAQRACTECHLVPGAPAPRAHTAAPRFEEIANRPATTEPGLRSLLRAPHAGMPMFRFTDAELDDVVAYLLSLRRRQG